MIAPVTILILQGDAEARLLADAGAVLQEVFPHLDLRVTFAWSTRSELLAPDAPGIPGDLVSRGLMPAIHSKDLLQQPWRLVIFSLLPDAALPILRCASGDAFVAHRGLREAWSPEERSWVDSEFRADELPDPAASAGALEGVIEQLQQRGVVVAISTVFRHVSEPLEHQRGQGAASLRERIRRTNLEAARLSHRTGCFVLDLDRTLAQEGGAALQTDGFGGTGRAAELALEELLALLFEALPDELMPLEVA